MYYRAVLVARGHASLIVEGGYEFHSYEVAGIVNSGRVGLTISVF